MYRREKDRAHQLRAWNRFHKLRASGWWGTFCEPSEWSLQKGRFRKGTGLGCPNGRSKCGVCSGGVREPTRQEVRSDIDFEEWKEDSMTGFM